MLLLGIGSGCRAFTPRTARKLQDKVIVALAARQEKRARLFAIIAFFYELLVKPSHMGTAARRGCLAYTGHFRRGRSGGFIEIGAQFGNRGKP
ncbi:MAG: hypothetical protein WEC82_06545, partial [Xanthobacteraceae bacterium]